MPVRNKALALTDGLLQKDYTAEAARCLAYCRDRVRYVKDILGVETLHDPVTLLNIEAGDCDDKSVLLASLLASIGHRVQFVAASFQPGTYSHVWVRDYLYGRWVDLEPTEPLQFGERIPARAVIAEMTQEV